MKDKIKGGLSDKLSIYDIVKKHSDVLEKLGFVSMKEKFDKIKKEISIGMEVEMEHTDSKMMAKEIAMDHLYESPIYYTELKKMEKESEKILKESKRFRELIGISESENKKQLSSEDFIDNYKNVNKKSLIEEGFNKENFEIIEFETGDFSPIEDDNTLYSLNESVLLEIEEEDDFYSDFLKQEMVSDAIKEAGIENEDMGELAFDAAEAIHIYTHDFNEDSKEIRFLKNLLIKNFFKISPSIKYERDLTKNGKKIYNALISLYQKDYKPYIGQSLEDDGDIPGPTKK